MEEDLDIEVENEDVEKEEDALERCLRRLNFFCYCCGRFVRNLTRRPIYTDIENLYNLYFRPHVIIKGVNWAPSVFCKSCINRLTEWASGTSSQMNFGVPTMWSQPVGEHNSGECFVCCNYGYGMNRKAAAKRTIQSTRWVQLPLPHSDTVPVPKRPSPMNISSGPSESETISESKMSEYLPSSETPNCTHEEFTQQDIDDLVKELGLSQRKTIILSSKLKEKNLLSTGARVYAARGRQLELTKYFKSIDNNTFAYCDDIVGLMTAMHYGAYKSEEWRLFIDSSKKSLKAVLLHFENSKNSVPVALSTNTKETYLSLEKILVSIKYNEHSWKICADLKVITLLSGLQTGYTKNMCFMCLWDTRYKGDQYEKYDWPVRPHQHTLGRGNVIELPLVPMNKILLPPLHIKLGIVKNFIKSLNPTENAFQELTRIFPRLSPAKVKEGVLMMTF